jgi:hypothetical protein
MSEDIRSGRRRKQDKAGEEYFSLLPLFQDQERAARLAEQRAEQAAAAMMRIKHRASLVCSLVMALP